ncbi:glycosyltransferase family 4 protein [Nitrosomonas communis]|uniref:Glycosyltransferase involved in cell wall bisynthesis n=1 Tax=Nitrosomonas communis TaxID=44574 RepID=A0A1H2Q962_9PROT|nr:glycosyltransferase family 1 protein [Nitrosomonas communis]SDW03686.1 Glycosyltransferase involved in cell wall bisynthesis [Nitrosomonas communis]
MRIVIDMQGVQGDSRHRGIGRYSMALAQAMVRNRGSHEILIALNGLFPESIEPIRAAFDGIMPQENIRVWHAVHPVKSLDPANTWRRHTVELMREAFLESLTPDIVHISSLFEGFGDDAVHSIGLCQAQYLTAVTLYDLIPLIQSETYLKPNPTYEAFYREKIEYLKRADLFLAISESSRQEAIKHLELPSSNIMNISAAANDLFKPINISVPDEQAIRKRFQLSKPFLMYSGATDERKNHLRLIKAFSLLSPELQAKFQLAIVGHLPDNHRQKFNTYAEICGLKPSDVVITGKVTDEELVKLYNLCTLFVFPSCYEGFGLPALEAMACGAPVVGSNNSSVPEVIGFNDALFDPFDARSISEKMTKVLCDEHFRRQLVKHGLEQAKKFSWDRCAKKAISSFELLYAKQNQPIGSTKGLLSKSQTVSWLINKITQLQQPPSEEYDWISTASAIAKNHSQSIEKQLLVDISELVHRDAKTGIQRVVRSVLVELLQSPPHGFRVEPVYAIHNQSGYRYARKFKQQFLNLQDSAVIDDPIEVSNDDIFLGLDLQHHVVLQQANYYSYLRDIGVKVYFIVYDLLPVYLPEMFPLGASPMHAQWLGVLAQTDGVVCISRAVADEMNEWLSVYGPQRKRSFKIGSFHLGADVAGSIPTKGMPQDAHYVLDTLSSRPTFLMVGTIEPRKGQMQTLLSFEALWSQGEEINLVMVGKRGWNVDLLVEMLRTHSELNHRLFWLEGISDEYLKEVYANSTCLIAASQGEGFGLPLIEAAQHGLPIIARDIPVFREVAGEHAFYFMDDIESGVITQAVKQWLSLFEKGEYPKSESMPWLTWRESTQQLLDVILNDNWYQTWMPDRILRYYGADDRLGTQVGVRRGRNMITTGIAGFLIFGPYVALDAGNYQVSIFGNMRNSVNNTRVDVSANQGHQILAEELITDSESENCLITLPFTLHTPSNDLEIRMWVEEGTDLSVSLVKIEPCLTAESHSTKSIISDMYTASEINL